MPSKQESDRKEMEKLLNALHTKYDIPQDDTPKEFVSTGLMALDMATCRGGIPRGLLMDLYGDEGLGKTSLVLTMIAERIRCGERCAFIDVEKRLDQNMIDMLVPGHNMGKKNSMLELFRPTDGDNALTVVESILQFPEFRMMAIDSVSALVFTDMTEADKHTEPIGILARRMSTHTKRIMEPIFRNNTIMILINQIRAQMNFRGQVSFVPTGGRAIKFFSSLRISLHRDEFIGPKEKPLGQKLRLRIDKNSFGPPFREASASLVYGSGFDTTRDMIDVGIELGVINQAASWMTYTDTDEKGVVNEIRAHGEADLAEKLKPIAERVKARIHAKMAEIKVEEVPGGQEPVEE